MYKIKVTHTAPSYGQFNEWGVQEAYPDFYQFVIFKTKIKTSILVLLMIKMNKSYGVK